MKFLMTWNPPKMDVFEGACHTNGACRLLWWEVLHARIHL
jgi:hypothetical protein